jgi:uncharacterized protein YxjI
MHKDRFPFIVVGEILSASPAENNPAINRWTYTVKVFMPHETLVADAIMMEPFSGPLNHFQIKPDVSGGINHFDTKGRITQGDTFTRGSRCLVAFAGGEENSPIIIGMLPHPHSTYSISRMLPSPSRIFQEINKEHVNSHVYPALDMKFNGVTFQINETGEILIRKEGASYIDDNIESTGPGGLGSLFMSFLDNGQWRIKNANRMSFEMTLDRISMDAESSSISIVRKSGSLLSDLFIDVSGTTVFTTFNDLVLSIGDAFILNAAKGLDIYTDDKFSLEVMKTFDLKVGENSTVELKKDFLFKTIGKSTINLEDDVTLGAKKKLTATVGDALTLSVEKAFKTTVKDEYSVKSDKSMKLEGKDFLGADEKGAKLVLKGGKVALGNDQAELFDALYTVFDKILKGGAQFAIGAQGPAVIGPEVSTAVGEFLMALQKVKGSL